MAASKENRREPLHLWLVLVVCLTLFQVEFGACDQDVFSFSRVWQSLPVPENQAVGSLTFNSTVYRPKVPYLGTLSEHLRVGSVIRIRGYVPSKTESFSINLCADCSEGPVHLHISVRLHSNQVVRNSYQNGQWKAEENDVGSLRNFPFDVNQEFVLRIEVKPQAYDISVNGMHAWNFAHRVPYSTVEKLEIRGGPVLIWKIEYTDVAHEQVKNEVIPSVDTNERTKNHFNGHIVNGMTVHIDEDASNAIEKFILDLRCECRPQNSVLETEGEK